MKKLIFACGVLGVLVVSMSSCKKCYECSLTTTVVKYNQDSTYVLKTEICNGPEGAGHNLKVTVADVESNGYICTPK